LTDALRADGALPSGSAVTSVSWERIGEGIGFIGLNGRLRLAYAGDAAGAPASLIAKFPSDDDGARTVGNIFGLYEREVRFYQDLARDAGLRAPRCYYAAWDASEQRSLMLLEDLAETGEMGDQVAGCSMAQAAIALDELALFHARWWRSPDLYRFTWLQDGGEIVRGSLKDTYPLLWQTFLDLHGHMLLPSLRDAVPTLNERVTIVIDRLQHRGDMTLGHGDFRLDNMFFGRPGADYRLAVIDWQSPARGWGAYDVAYFMTSCVGTEERREHGQDALRAYHERLMQGGVRDYPFEALWEDYRGSLMAYLAISVITGATLQLSNERAVALFRLIFERLNAAIADADAANALA
jgi:hypothetical protein